MDLLGADMIAIARDDVSDAEIAIFATDIADTLPVRPTFLNGQVAELVDDPEFVYNDGTSTHKCKSVD